MSHIRWENLMETERRQFEGMNESERFVYFLLLQYGSPLRMGERKPRSVRLLGCGVHGLVRGHRVACTNHRG